MKQFKLLAGLIAILLAPVLTAGQAFAETISASAQITVTATVPSHRDIILDAQGRIAEIDSNTLEDVTPDVYAGSFGPEHKVALTDALLNAYRQHVPTGTARRGVLYKQNVILSRITLNPSSKTAVLYGLVTPATSLPFPGANS